MCVLGIVIFVELVMMCRLLVCCVVCEIFMLLFIMILCISVMYGFGYVKIVWFSVYFLMKNVLIVLWLLCCYVLWKKCMLLFV